MTTATKTARKRKKSDQLRRRQIQILECLARSRKPLSRKQIVAKCRHTSHDAGWYSIDLGAASPQARKRNQEIYYPSLLTHRYVTVDTTETNSGKEVIVYDITEKGLAALRALPKKTTS